MEPGFNELQFAYGCTRELEDGTWFIPPLGIPYFPTLYKEKILGYDVAFPGLVAPVFLQYKVAHYMKRTSAREYSLFGGPYFRFKIYPATRSPQHNQLVALARKQPFVFYCAPGFAEYQAYQNLHRDKKIAQHSVFFPCSFLPQNSGNDVHNIVYTINPPISYWCSEPIEIKSIVGWNGLVEYCYTLETVFDKLPNIINHLEELLHLDNLGSNNQYLMLERLYKIINAVMERYCLALGFLRKQ